jgi:pimeloyl-ACP methyl ester carboxylesterase
MKSGFVTLLTLCSCLLFTPGRAANATEFNVQKKTRSADGTEIAYVAGGAGETTIVFVHGWTCDRSYWAAQLQAFTEDYRVIALDLAGHGESAVGRETYSMASFGADVAAVASGTGPVVLVGHSMGGPVILAAAPLFGDRLAGLIAVDSLRDVTATPPSEAQIQKQLAPMREDYQAMARPRIASMFLETSDPVLRDEIIDDMLATDPHVGIEAVRGMMQMDVPAALSRLQVPLVVINSTYQPTNFGAIAALHRDSSIRLMDGVGHFVMQEDPETFNALLAEALASLAL